MLRRIVIGRSLEIATQQNDQSSREVFHKLKSYQISGSFQLRKSSSDICWRHEAFSVIILKKHHIIRTSVVDNIKACDGAIQSSGWKRKS